MVTTVDKNGWITNDAGIVAAPRPMIEHATMTSVRGIIVHQTGSSSADSSLNSYKNAGAAGAHFLIDKDGTTYQVASMYKITWHVGKLKAKCLESHTCSPQEIKASKPFNPSKLNKVEMVKSVPLRFPANNDAIGIEIVGKCVLDPKWIKPGMTADQISQLTDAHGVYETVTPAQNKALQQLVSKIQEGLAMSDEDKAQIYPHSQVSWKNVTEGTTAQWPGKQ